MGNKDFFKVLDRPIDEFLEPGKYRTTEESASLWFKRKAFWKKWAKPIIITPLLLTVFLSFLLIIHGLFLPEVVKSYFFVFALIVFTGYFFAVLLYIGHKAFNPKDPYEIPLYMKDSDED